MEAIKLFNSFQSASRVTVYNKIRVTAVVNLVQSSGHSCQFCRKYGCIIRQLRKICCILMDNSTTYTTGRLRPIRIQFSLAEMYIMMLQKP